MANKGNVVNAVVSEAGISKKEAGAVVNALINTITDALKRGDKVSMQGFGTFSVTERAARSGRDPRTGNPIQIAARKLPRFNAGRALVEEIIRKFEVKTSDDKDFGMTEQRFPLSPIRKKEETLKRAKEKIKKINEDVLNSEGLDEEEIKASVEEGIIDADQAYFWSKEHQKHHREAEKDIKNGKVKIFDDVEDLIKDLNS